jgi:hypothetical protein
MVLDGRGLDRGIPALITWLRRDGIIHVEMVPSMLDVIAVTGLSAEEVLADHGVPEGEMVRLHAQYFHVPVAPAEALPTQPEPPVLPEGFCRKHLLVPIGTTPSGLVIAMADPSRAWLHAQMTMMTGLDFELRVARVSQVKAWLDQMFPVTLKADSRA